MMSRRAAWLGLLGAALLVALLILIPGVLIRPFAPQSPSGVGTAFLLRRWSPLLSLLALVGASALVWRLWRGGRTWSRLASAALLALLAGGAWLARQDYFEWMFAPLPDARFVRLGAADFVQPGDMVLAVALAGEAVAYPVRQLAYHHLVEDAVGGVPIVATY